jgi:rubrerythrin
MMPHLLYYRKGVNVIGQESICEKFPWLIESNKRHWLEVSKLKERAINQET